MPLSSFWIKGRVEGITPWRGPGLGATLALQETVRLRSEGRTGQGLCVGVEGEGRGVGEKGLGGPEAQPSVATRRSGVRVRCGAGLVPVPSVLDTGTCALRWDCPGREGRGQGEGPGSERRG